MNRIASLPRAVGVVFAGAIAWACVVSGASAPPAGAAGCSATVTFTPDVASQIPGTVAACPGGTVFRFAAGTYRMTAPIVPVSGDAFEGAGSSASGTVLYGSRVVTGWTYSSADRLWEHSGDTTSGTPLAGNCYSADPNAVVTACQYPDWLFRNGVELKRVVAPCTSASVGHGSFCIDYGAQLMYMGSDPGSSQIDYSFVPAAVLDDQISGVTVEGVRIKEYANATGHAGALSAGDNWVVDHVVVLHNHGCGVKVNGAMGTLVERSTFSDNGWEGFCGSSTGATFTHNTVKGNNVLGFDAGWDAGGGKFANSQNLVVSHNSIVGNNGTGLWFDVGDDGVTALGNVIKNNTAKYGAGDGLRFEISCNGTIGSNSVSGNARLGISVVNSSSVAVGSASQGNTVSGNAGGPIRVLADGRAGSNACGPENTAVQDQVDHNHMTLASGDVVGVINAGGVVSNDVFTNNVYSTSGSCGLPFWTWWNGSKNEHDTFAAWQGRGQDTGGSCS
jgi:hypothetical protein